MNRKLHGAAAVLTAAMSTIVIAAFTQAPVVALIAAAAGITAVPVFLRASRGGGGR